VGKSTILNAILRILAAKTVKLQLCAPAGRAAKRLKTEYLDKGRLGQATGQGFYSYPDRSFVRSHFLSNG